MEPQWYSTALTYSEPLTLLPIMSRGFKLQQTVYYSSRSLLYLRPETGSQEGLERQRKSLGNVSTM